MFLLVSFVLSSERDSTKEYVIEGEKEIIYEIDYIIVPNYVITETIIPSRCVYNETAKDVICVEEKIKETVILEGKKVIEVRGDRIGIRANEEDINGIINGNQIIEWSIPLGDRNFKEFGYCLLYELEKNICSERRIQ